MAPEQNKSKKHWRQLLVKIRAFQTYQKCKSCKFDIQNRKNLRVLFCFSQFNCFLIYHISWVSVPLRKWGKIGSLQNFYSIKMRNLLNKFYHSSFHIGFSNNILNEPRIQFHIRLKKKRMSAINITGFLLKHWRVKMESWYFLVHKNIERTN